MVMLLTLESKCLQLASILCVFPPAVYFRVALNFFEFAILYDTEDVFGLSLP